MSLDTKQKLVVVAVVGGLATLPVVGAQILNNKAVTTTTTVTTSQSPQSGSGHIISVDGSKTTSISPQTSGITQNTAYNNSGTSDLGPAANQRQNNDSMNQLDQSGNNNFDNKAMPVSGGSCEYSKNAIKAGVKHYRFQQANEATLVDVGGGHKLAPEAATALKKLQAAARADGVTLTVGSAFRSISYQQGIVARKKAAGQSDAQIYKVSSAPGYSEHHTGYALDFSPINNAFANSKAYAWLKQHGNEYGWYQSFTPESVRNTHVAVESWHWKYKGSATAKAALANDVCYFNP